MSKVFVISDLHFGHVNVSRWRGFSSVEEHDNTIISNWNSVVSKRDLVWVLGDVAMNKKYYSYMSLLNGTKNLVLGNHDVPKNLKLLQEYFNKICSCMVFKNLILTHIPIHENELKRFKNNVHGHTHNIVYRDMRYINVCCEQTEYKPVELFNLIK